MSDMRVALVAEGPTDYHVIHAALRVILPEAFILTQLQPEATMPAMGSGWGGVLKWCHGSATRGAVSLSEDPTLSGFDLLIIHLDADVAAGVYDQCGDETARKAVDLKWSQLPCAQPYPPITPTIDALTDVLTSWLAPVSPGSRTVFCLPAQSMGTWLAAAILPPGHRLLNAVECNTHIENQLPVLPLDLRVKKTGRDYKNKASAVAEKWDHVKALCNQAVAFEQAVLAAIP